MYDNPYNPADYYDIKKQDYTEEYLRYPDDEAYWTYLLKSQWALGDVGEFGYPQFYYSTEEDSTRDNSSTGGSIFIYTTSMNQNKILGINYDSVNRTKGMCIDIQSTSRERCIAWMKECMRILEDFRRAGRTRLGGWDYLEITSQNNMFRNYQNFFQMTIDFKLMRVAREFETDGRGKDIFIQNNRINRKKTNYNQ